MSLEKKVLIQIIGEQPILKKLNLEDSLLDIRNKNNNIIDDVLLFSAKSGDEYAEIKREDEKKYRLKEIATEVDNDLYILYLMKKPCWEIFNDNCKLDYGRTMSFDGIKRANKRAFKMKDCELTEINAEGYKKDHLEFNRKRIG